MAGSFRCWFVKKYCWLVCVREKYYSGWKFTIVYDKPQPNEQADGGPAWLKWYHVGNLLRMGEPALETDRVEMDRGPGAVIRLFGWLVRFVAGS